MSKCSSNFKSFSEVFNASCHLCAHFPGLHGARHVTQVLPFLEARRYKYAAGIDDDQSQTSDMPASTKALRFTRTEDIVLIEALHKMLNDFDCSRGPKWGHLADILLRVCGHQHSGPHIRNQICRLIHHLYDSNADVMINAYRRTRTFNSIRSAVYASSLPNGTYPDPYDSEKFKLQVEAAAEKCTDLDIRWADYELPDLFTMIKKTPADVKDWLEGALKTGSPPKPVVCKPSPSRKGVGMSFSMSAAAAEQVVEEEDEDFEELPDDGEDAKIGEGEDDLNISAFEDSDLEVGDAEEQTWLKDRSDAIRALAKVADRCSSAQSMERLAQNLADFIEAGPDADRQALLAILNKDAMLASGSQCVLKRLQIAQKVEALLNSTDAPSTAGDKLKAELYAAVNSKNVNAAVACLHSPGIKGIIKGSGIEWIQEQLRILSSQPAVKFASQASFWTELLHCLTHGHAAGESFFGMAKTPQKPLPKAKKTGSRSGDRDAALDQLDDHMTNHSPVIKEGAGRTIVKSKVAGDFAQHSSLICAVLSYALFSHMCHMHCALICAVLSYALCSRMRCALICAVLSYALK